MVLLGVVVLAVVGALYFVESDRARELAREAAADHGLALDYRRLALSPTRGELRLEGFRLPMPERCRAFGDDWLSVATLDVRWEPGAILDGIVRGLRVGLDDVALVYAIDAEGIDCTQLALAALLEVESSRSDPTPLSQTLASLTVPEGFELASLAVRGLRVRYVDASRDLEGSLEGLGIEAHAREEGGRLQGELVLASDAEGTRLRLGGVEVRLRTEHRVTLGDVLVWLLSFVMSPLFYPLPRGTSRPEAVNLGNGNEVGRFADERFLFPTYLAALEVRPRARN